MGQLFQLSRFKAGQPLLDQLTAERLNAMADAIDQAVAIPGDNMTSQRVPGGVILRSRATAGAGSTSTHPFKVTATTRSDTVDDEPNVRVGVTIEPGRISGLVPFALDADLGNVKLDNVPAPQLDVSSNGIQKVVIRCELTTDPGALFNPLVISAATAQIGFGDVDSEPTDITDGFRIIWDDTPTPPAPHSTGHTYIKVAEITVATQDERKVITRIKQLLFTEYRTFVALGDVFIPLL